MTKTIAPISHFSGITMKHLAERHWVFFCRSCRRWRRRCDPSDTSSASTLIQLPSSLLALLLDKWVLRTFRTVSYWTLTSPGVPGPPGESRRTSASRWDPLSPISWPRCGQNTKTLWRRSPPSSAAPPEWAQGLQDKRGKENSLLTKQHKDTGLLWHFRYRRALTAKR